MREIKFRGKINGHWHYATPDRDVDEWEWFWALVDLETVGQYIGRKDKNDKEIYSGDTVRIHDEYNIEIKWKEEGDGYEIVGGYYLPQRQKFWEVINKEVS